MCSAHARTIGRADDRRSIRPTLRLARRTASPRSRPPCVAVGASRSAVASTSASGYLAKKGLGSRMMMLSTSERTTWTLNSRISKRSAVLNEPSLRYSVCPCPGDALSAGLASSALGVLIKKEATSSSSKMPSAGLSIAPSSRQVTLLRARFAIQLVAKSWYLALAKATKTKLCSSATDRTSASVRFCTAAEDSERTRSHAIGTPGTARAQRASRARRRRSRHGVSSGIAAAGAAAAAAGPRLGVRTTPLAVRTTKWSRAPAAVRSSVRLAPTARATNATSITVARIGREARSFPAIYARVW